jgi:predicted secreted protein
MFSPEMPKVSGLYSSLFFCGILVALWREFFAIIPPSWRTWFTSAWEAAPGSVCSARRKAWVHVLNIHRGVLSAGRRARDYVLNIHRRVLSAGWEAWVFVLGAYDRIRVFVR